MLEGFLYGLRHVDKKLVGVGRSVLEEESGGPTIHLGVRIEREQETLEIWQVFLGVGNRVSPGVALDVRRPKASRNMVETNCALETKLRSPLSEMGSRDMIAEIIPGPGDLARCRGNCQLGFENPLILVVARTQHHAVRAERNRPPVDV